MSNLLNATELSNLVKSITAQVREELKKEGLTTTSAPPGSDYDLFVSEFSNNPDYRRNWFRDHFSKEEMDVLKDYNKSMKNADDLDDDSLGVLQNNYHAFKYKKPASVKDEKNGTKDADKSKVALKKTWVSLAMVRK